MVQAEIEIPARTSSSAGLRQRRRENTCTTAVCDPEVFAVTKRSPRLLHDRPCLTLCG